MLKNLHSSAVLFVTWLALLAGCSSPQLPVDTSSSPRSDALRSSTNQIETKTKVAASKSNNIYINPVATVTKQNMSLTVLPERSNLAINAEIQQYVNRLAANGFAKENQGVWIQSGNTLLASHQGTVPLPAASVTKVATTLAALQTFGPEHRFITLIGATGPITNGELRGDLVIVGGEDPFFVWEEAVAVGNLLNQMGIKRVIGNLLIVGKFYMNFKSAPSRGDEEAKKLAV